MSDELWSLVGNVTAQIYDWHSKGSWLHLFTPSTKNSEVLKEALDLAFQGKYDLVFFTIFKGIEAEAKRLLPKGYDREKPERIISAVQDAGLVSECEFHFLNALRALRNEVGHGRPYEPASSERVFLENEVKAGILVAILILMRLQTNEKAANPN